MQTGVFREGNQEEEEDKDEEGEADLPLKIKQPHSEEVGNPSSLLLRGGG